MLVSYVRSNVFQSGSLCNLHPGGLNKLARIAPSPLHQHRIKRSVSSNPYYYDIEFKKDPGYWRSDPQFNRHLAQKKWRNLKITRRKEKFVLFNPSENPAGFTTSWLSILFLIYCIFSLGTGETMPQRRRRIIQDRLYMEYGLTENDVDEIEGMEDPPLSDQDSESYAQIMDPLLEPKQDTFTAWVLEPWLEKMQDQLAQDPSTSNYPAVVALEQLQQGRKELPLEIREFVKKTDSELLVEQLLERKQGLSTLTQKIDEFPGEYNEEVIHLPRGDVKGKSHNKFKL